jgi:hypothetical protein
VDWSAWDLSPAEWVHMLLMETNESVWPSLLVRGSMQHIEMLSRSTVDSDGRGLVAGAGNR